MHDVAGEDERVVIGADELRPQIVAVPAGISSWICIRFGDDQTDHQRDGSLFFFCEFVTTGLTQGELKFNPALNAAGRLPEPATLRKS